MPWGWECRAKLVKQLPAKPTQRRGKADQRKPGPQQYDPPTIYCGKGYSHIKRSPAYTFGHQTPITFTKPVIKPTAPMLDTCGMGPKGGPYKIKYGIVSPQIDPPQEKVKTPGPAAYCPGTTVKYKMSPAFSVRPAARPPYQPWDQWTPSPNMYLPYHPGKKSPPAFTIGYVAKELSTQTMPSPGQHEPNYRYVQKSNPAFSFGAPFRTLRPVRKPAPNTYCEKKFMYTKRTIPAPSFGIRHTPYLGRQHEYLKPPKLDIFIAGESSPKH